MPYQRKRPAPDPCPVETVLAIVGGRWKARILLLISQHDRGFAELRRGLPGVRQQVLAAQLQALEADGIVSRNRRVGARGPFSDYALTERGCRLMPVLWAMADWGNGELRTAGIIWTPPELAVPVAPRRSRGWLA